MKKLIFLILAIATTSFSVSPLRASDPFEAPSATPSPANVNIYDWYNLGELICATIEFNYNVGVYQQMDTAYKRVYDAMLKVHLSDSTIAAFKEFYAQLKKLPWDKDWPQWTKEEQDIWLSSPASLAFYKSINDEAGRSTPTLFFYWLGRQTLKAAWAIPYYQSQGWKKDVTSAMKNVSQDCYSFSTDSTYSAIFEALAQDVQKAISLMGSAYAKLKPKPEDPFSTGGAAPDPVSDDDIAKIVTAAKQIRADAQAHKLIKD